MSTLGGGGGGKTFNPVLSGGEGGGAKKFGPAIFPFCSTSRGHFNVNYPVAAYTNKVSKAS